MTDDAASAALQRILPAVARQQAEHTSWEESAANLLSPDTGNGGRLMHLRVLLWPNIPTNLLRFARLNCPRVLVNPDADQIKSSQQQLQMETPPADQCGWQAFVAPPVDLDAHIILEGVHDASRWDVKHVEPPTLSLAEKFKLAYVERARYLAARERVTRRQQEQKKVRSSSSLQAINSWLNEQ